MTYTVLQFSKVISPYFLGWVSLWKSLCTHVAFAFENASEYFSKAVWTQFTQSTTFLLILSAISLLNSSKSTNWLEFPFDFSQSWLSTCFDGQATSQSAKSSKSGFQGLQLQLLKSNSSKSRLQLVNSYSCKFRMFIHCLSCSNPSFALRWTRFHFNSIIKS